MAAERRPAGDRDVPALPESCPVAAETLAREARAVTPRYCLAGLVTLAISLGRGVLGVLGLVTALAEIAGLQGPVQGRRCSLGNR